MQQNGSRRTRKAVDAVAKVKQDDLQRITRYCLAKAMVEGGYTYDQTAEVVGISRRSVARVMAGEYDLPEGMLAALKSAEVLKWTIVQHQALDHFAENSEEVLKKANAVQLVTAAAIAQDKRAAILGEPTQIVEHRLSGLSPQELAARVVKLREEIANNRYADAIDVEGEEIAPEGPQNAVSDAPGAECGLPLPGGEIGQEEPPTGSV